MLVEVCYGHSSQDTEWDVSPPPPGDTFWLPGIYFQLGTSSMIGPLTGVGAVVVPKNIFLFTDKH